ncbi:MAG: hypothetical protein KDB23_29755 [Planctomycetales bacterium]|nr:hypothetical protein [Planctomycetales bacterium]
MRSRRNWMLVGATLAMLLSGHSVEASNSLLTDFSRWIGYGFGDGYHSCPCPDQLGTGCQTCPRGDLFSTGAACQSCQPQAAIRRQPTLATPPTVGCARLEPNSQTSVRRTAAARTQYPLPPQRTLTARAKSNASAATPSRRGDDSR